jgi:hypothetical protein
MLVSRMFSDILNGGFRASAGPGARAHYVSSEIGGFADITLFANSLPRMRSRALRRRREPLLRRVDEPPATEMVVEGYRGYCRTCFRRDETTGDNYPVYRSTRSTSPRRRSLRAITPHESAHARPAHQPAITSVG